MSNEIKYVNEAGVRRIITDTRARLTDLTTDVDSAFGFSLDLSDIDTSLNAYRTISFSLPKEFSTDEYDIFARLHTKLTRTSTNSDIITETSNAVALVPLSSDTTRYVVSEHHLTPAIIHTANTETISGQQTTYIHHSRFGIYTDTMIISAKLNNSIEGVYSLNIAPVIYSNGHVEHIYGSVSSASSIVMNGSISVAFETVSGSSLGLSYAREIKAIEILVRKKLEATAE